MTTTLDDVRLLDSRRTAELLCISKRTLDSLVERGVLAPIQLVPGGMSRWKKAAVIVAAVFVGLILGALVPSNKSTNNQSVPSPPAVTTTVTNTVTTPATSAAPKSSAVPKSSVPKTPATTAPKSHAPSAAALAPAAFYPRAGGKPRLAGLRADRGSESPFPASPPDASRL